MLPKCDISREATCGAQEKKMNEEKRIESLSSRINSSSYEDTDYICTLWMWTPGKTMQTMTVSIVFSHVKFLVFRTSLLVSTLWFQSAKAYVGATIAIIVYAIISLVLAPEMTKV